MGLHPLYNNMKTNSAGALLFVIITALVLTLVGSTFVLLTTNQYKIFDSEVNRIRAFYRAQAGMEYAIYQAYTNPATWLPSAPVPPATSTTINHNDISIDGGTVNISITTPGTLSNYNITIST